MFSKSSKQKQWVINPELKKLVRKKFDPITQHDSHEFMVYLLEQLQDEETLSSAVFSAPDPKLSQRQVCEQYDQLRTSIVDRLFTGMQRTAVSCAKCSYQSLTYNPFMTISLACKTSVDSAIREHLSEVKTDGQYKCDKCKRESKARVSHEFVRLPPFLLLHVKRFDDLLTKINSKIMYPS